MRFLFHELLVSAESILSAFSKFFWRRFIFLAAYQSGLTIDEAKCTFLARWATLALLGFLSIIAVELLQVTYLHRTQPDAPALEILTPIQIEVLKAATSKQLPSTLTVAWAVESVAYLGGYLEHRRKTPIGIQVLWRGWLKLHDLCQGWQLARGT